MKNKKKTVIACVVILVLSFLVSGIYMYLNRSTSRAATPAELEAYAPYTVDWSAAGMEAGISEREHILSMCAQTGQEEIGSNVYRTYSSDTLGGYLYKCAQVTEITTAAEGQLYVSYTDTDGRTVILGYDEEGLFEKGIYEPDADTFYHELDGNIEVWEKFRTGAQFGA